MVQYVKVPSIEKNGLKVNEFTMGNGNHSDNNMNMSPITERLRKQEEEEKNSEYLVCGDLYTFGLCKAGQLGHPLSDMKTTGVLVPTLVDFFPSSGYKVAKVSCGIHHTVVNHLKQ